MALTTAGTHLSFLRASVLGGLAQLHLRQNQFSQAEAVIEQGKQDSSQPLFPFFYQYPLLAEAELVLKQGEPKWALAVTDNLLANLHQFVMRPLISEALYLWGRCLMVLGQLDAARKTLLEAHTAAEAIGSRRLLWQILFALSRIETDPGEASRLRQRAQEIVESIVRNMSDPELRASFLELVEVQELLTLSSPSDERYTIQQR